MNQVQRKRMLDALSLIDLPFERVWLHYCGNGGRLTERHVELFLHGGAAMNDQERDILAHALNELLWDVEQPSLVPYVSAPLPASAVQGPEISAAAGWLLTDEEAESERLQSLAATGLMHSGPAPELDALVAEARTAFDVSSASVALIASDHQYLKASEGPLRQHLPRREAFCDEAIRTTNPMILPDTREDPRFREHPLVVDEPYLRFYAAHPLRGPGGWNIGTFCILDQRPHDFSAAERRSFRAFAHRVQAEIGRSRTAEDARRRHAACN